jgi:hypothetical protein
MGLAMTFFNFLKCGLLGFSMACWRRDSGFESGPVWGQSTIKPTIIEALA